MIGMCFMTWSTINRLLMFVKTAETCRKFSSGKFPWVDLNYSLYTVCPGHSTWTSPQTKIFSQEKNTKKLLIENCRRGISLLCIFFGEKNFTFIYRHCGSLQRKSQLFYFSPKSGPKCSYRYQNISRWRSCSNCNGFLNQFHVCFRCSEFLLRESVVFGHFYVNAKD